MKKLKTFLVVFIGAISFGVSAQLSAVSHQLDSLVIRSFTVASNQALAGIKGNAGDGIVYKCTINTWNWKATNHGKPIGKNVEDVQAVAIVNDSVYLAGTWKNGLYRTDDAGGTWEKINEFPSIDVRSIKVIDHDYIRIYAATTTSGILESLDLGKTWTVCGINSTDKSLASWSLELDPITDGKLFALTFKDGILQSNDHGKTWVSSLKVDGIMFYDMVISKTYPKNIVAVGSNDSIGVIYGSVDGGLTWYFVENELNALFSQVEFGGKSEQTILLGSWDRGAFMNNRSDWNSLQEVAFNNISGIYSDQNQMVFATWGNGLFRIGESKLPYDISTLGPKLLGDEEIIEHEPAILHAKREVILKRRITRDRLHIIIKGYTQEVVGFTTMSDQPQPIYGKKKKFKRVEPYLRDTQIRQKFGI
jgi:photosystem II stability/assembly factor-like uncharacterized protein